MRRAARRSDLVVVGIAVVVHAWCVLVAMRRYVRGTADESLTNFLHFPIWTPPLGITGTLIVVALAHAAAWWALSRASAGWALTDAASAGPVAHSVG